MGISVIAELDVEQRARKAAFSCDGRVGSSRAACLGWWATLQNPTLFFFFFCHGEPPPHPRSTPLLVRRKQREKQIIVARHSRRPSDPKTLFVPFPHSPLHSTPLPRAASKCRRCCPSAAGPPRFPCYCSYRSSPPPHSSSPRAPQQPPSEVSSFLLFSSSIALRIYNE